MRLLALLINAHICYGVVIHINPIKIIAYRRNQTSDDTRGPYNEKTNSEAVRKKTKLTPFIDNTTSYSGHIIANSKHGVQLFYWFFPSQSNPSKDPLLVWFQGQPNASALYGMFDEHGPYQINSQDLTMRLRNNSWNKVNNVLYMDLYPGCGFSFATTPKGYSQRLEDVSKNVINALNQFFYIHPYVTSNSLYFSGESLSGKYMFMMAYNIYRRKSFTHSRRFNLKGLIIGNGFVDSMQLSNYKSVLLQMGLFDLKDYDEVGREETHIDSLVQAGQYQTAIDAWYKEIYSKVRYSGYDSLYDVRDINAFWNSLVPVFFNRTDIRQWLGVGNSTFQSASRHVYITREALRPINEKIVPLLLDQYKILFYTGQFDMFASYIHTALFLDSLPWSNLKHFYDSSQIRWSESNDFYGTWKSYANLTHLMIRNAGHTVGTSQPEALFRMINKFIKNEFKATQVYN